MFKITIEKTDAREAGQYLSLVYEQHIEELDVPAVITVVNQTVAEVHASVDVSSMVNRLVQQARDMGVDVPVEPSEKTTGHDHLGTRGEIVIECETCDAVGRFVKIADWAVQTNGKWSCPDCCEKKSENPS